MKRNWGMGQGIEEATERKRKRREENERGKESGNGRKGEEKE